VTRHQRAEIATLFLKHLLAAELLVVAMSFIPFQVVSILDRVAHQHQDTTLGEKPRMWQWQTLSLFLKEILIADDSVAAPLWATDITVERLSGQLISPSRDLSPCYRSLSCTRFLVYQSRSLSPPWISGCAD
jgi:hypothetical protein